VGGKGKKIPGQAFGGLIGFPWKKAVRKVKEFDIPGGSIKKERKCEKFESAPCTGNSEPKLPKKKGQRGHFRWQRPVSADGRGSGPTQKSLKKGGSGRTNPEYEKKGVKRKKNYFG